MTRKDDGVVRFFLPSTDQAVVEMMKSAGFVWTNNQADAEIIVFTGGADVHPALYGERVHPSTCVNGVRDNKDIKAWNARDPDQVCVGICRGGQFLNVMNGGKMWQHVTNHAVHGTHNMYSTEDSQVVAVTSTHHQMMIPTDKADILYTANIAMVKEGYDKVKKYTPDERRATWDDVEVCVYPATKSLCYQPHPEYNTPGNLQNRKLFIELVLEMLIHGKVPPAGGTIPGAQRSEESEEARRAVRH